MPDRDSRQLSDFASDDHVASNALDAGIGVGLGLNRKSANNDDAAHLGLEAFVGEDREQMARLLVRQEFAVHAELMPRRGALAARHGAFGDGESLATRDACDRKHQLLRGLSMSCSVGRQKSQSLFASRRTLSFGRRAVRAVAGLAAPKRVSYDIEGNGRKVTSAEHVANRSFAQYPEGSLAPLRKGCPGPSLRPLPN